MNVALASIPEPVAVVQNRGDDGSNASGGAAESAAGRRRRSENANDVDGRMPRAATAMLAEPTTAAGQLHR